METITKMDDCCGGAQHVSGTRIHIGKRLRCKVHYDCWTEGDSIHIERENKPVILLLRVTLLQVTR